MDTHKSNPLQTLAEKLCQFFIQALKKLDTEAFAPLQTHQGKILRLDAADLSVTLYFKIAEGTILVSTMLNADETPTTSLSGKFLDIIKLGFASESAMALFSQHHIQVMGDTGFLMALNKTVKEIDIDWEEHLSRILGDFTAHNLSKTLKKGLGWVKRCTTNRTRDLSAYLQEEIKLLPTKVELDYFCQDVTELKTDVEKLIMRVERLKQG